MVFYVGIYQSSLEGLLYVSAYDENSKTTNILSVHEAINNNEICEVLKTIKNDIDGDLQNLCIYFEQKFDDNDLKSCIETGKNQGFKAVEILSISANKYLQAITKANYNPNAVDIIWIYDPEGCRIWEICDKKVKLQVWLPYNGLDWKDLRRMKDIFKSKEPNAIIYVHKVNVSKEEVKEWYPNCQSFFCNSDPIMDIPLLKARLINNNAVEDGIFDVVNVLDKKVQVHYDGKMILSFAEFEQLPCEKFVKVVKVDGEHNFTLHKDNHIEKIALPPEFNRFLLTIAFDVNGIMSATFKELPQLSNVNGEVERLYSHYLDKANDELRPLKIDKEYNFLKNEFINDPSINAVGISLGAINFCCAVNRANGIETIALDNKGERLLPSYVGFDESHEKCGQIVVDRLQNHAESSVFDLKQIIGQNYDSSLSSNNWPFHVIPVEDSEARIQLQSNNQKVAKQSEEILAVIFRLIKHKTEEFQGKTLSEVVLTIPYKFNEKQRNSTFIAANFAGWKAVHLLPDSVATVFAYYFKTPPTQKITALVFDLGGGALDLSVLKISNQKVGIIHSNEINSINGKMFDSILVEYFENELLKQCKITLDKNGKQKLLKESQIIKESLATFDEAFLEVDKLDATKDALITITRKHFESLCAEILNKITRIINITLVESKSRKIDKIFYGGGGSRMPMIKNLLKSYFPHAEHCIHQNPEEVAAIGAAYYAYYLNSSTRRLISLSLRNEANYHFQQWFQQNRDEIEEMFQRR